LFGPVGSYTPERMMAGILKPQEQTNVFVSLSNAIIALHFGHFLHSTNDSGTRLNGGGMNMSLALFDMNDLGT